ncbi:CCA tRNA nucleotidyltransferase [Synechococcus lacustris]|uniref:CCA tRNA nucleotidyltransferase n=1 Tax=Synechococcus lacustris TaxID=2116544 RepID=UPI0020CEC2DD|nr:CCA tRNA nucleotidyltransferase [Synechococcus lacustris]MCP9923345.1 CCA tRNA nucleotidyltransferase [Synechococcus lacustris Cruz CV12-2]
MSLPYPVWIEWLVAIATPLQLQLSLVGGAVRDQLLGQALPLKDLDLVVEGPASWPALVLAEAIVAAAAASQLPLGYQLLQCTPYSNYGTARLQLQTNGGLLFCDLSSARSENYGFPGDHPSVESANLQIDLQRRDFSINALAMRLPNLELLDLFGGRKDLAAKQLQLLHSGSIRDDPTRLIRAVRYGARFDLQWAPASWEQASVMLNSWPWPPGAPALGARLRMELELLFAETNWRGALLLLEQWRGLELLQRGWQRLPRGSARFLSRFGRWGADLEPAFSAAELRLFALIDLAPSAAVDKQAIAERLQIPQRLWELLGQVAELRHWLQRERPSNSWRPSQWTAALEQPGNGGQPLAVLLVLLQPGEPARYYLLRWLLRWRLQRPAIGGKELLALGYQPGPELGKRLWQERAKEIDKNNKK